MVACMVACLVTFTASGIVDLDGDGLDDVWQSIYGATNVDVDVDVDEDGHTYREESVAGTDPDDPTSLLRVVVKPDEANFVGWPTVQGKRYRIQIADDLGSDHWTDVKSPVVGTGGPIVFSSVSAIDEIGRAHV